jgi:transposase-like protein
VRHTQEIGNLLPELYLHGLAQGDFELALRGLLGDGAPLSESSLGRLKEKWQAEYEAWLSQSLAELEVVYLWVDGIYVKAGLEKEKACLLIALAGLSDGRKVFVGLQAGQRESIQSWSSMLRSLRERGMCAPKLVIGDGNLGIWGGLRNVYPQAQEQRCWNHRVLNILDRISKKLQASAKLMLKNIPLAETKAECEKRKTQFQTWCRQHAYHQAAELIEQDWERMITFYQFPKEHWKHLRTSNPIESPFAVVRLRTDAAKRFKKVANASAMIWKMMLVAEKKFRRLHAPQLLMDVFNGAVYLNGKQVKTKADQEVAA